MENSFQTSFIPKKLISSASSEKEPKSFFMMLSIFILVVSIVSSGGLFAYKMYLIEQQASLSASLSNTRDSFEKDTIEELELFNKRTESAKQILSNHIALSPMFALLGDITIPSIQYLDFLQQTDKNGFLVNIKGVARDYRSIALQADMFNTSDKGRYFKNVLFSDLTKDKNNNINFNLKFNIDPSILSYENTIKSNQGSTNTIPTTPVVPEASLPTDLNNKTQ